VRIVHISTVLTLRAHQCTEAAADFWDEGVSQEYRKLLTFNHWWASLGDASNWNRTLRWREVCRKVCVTYG
jgi:hypothetical protein